MEQQEKEYSPEFVTRGPRFNGDLSLVILNTVVRVPADIRFVSEHLLLGILRNLFQGMKLTLNILFAGIFVRIEALLRRC
jgi:hypothetical protein